MFDHKVRVEYNHFPAIGKAMEPLIAAVIKKATLDIEAAMKRRVPVLTGFLKNSITSQMLQPNHGRVTVGAAYGVYVNYGTTIMPARPFVEPSTDEIRPEFIKACGLALKEAGRTK